MTHGICIPWKTGTMQSETNLVQRIASADENALRVFFDLHGNSMLAYAIRLVNDQQLAEEIVQDSLVAIWKGARSYRAQSKELTWALGIVYHKSISALRKRQDLQLEETTLDPSEQSLPELQIDASERKQLLRQILCELPVDQKSILELVFYQHLSLEECAQVMNCPLGTVKSRLFTARDNLRKLLARHGYAMEDLL